MAHRKDLASKSRALLACAAGLVGVGLVANRAATRRERQDANRLEQLVDRIETVAIDAERRANDRQRAWYAGYLAGLRDQPLPDDHDSDVVVQLLPRRAPRQPAQTPPITSTRS